MASDASRDLDRVVEHYVSRLRQGEHPNVEDYAKRHPELAAEIREVFPLLSMMEGVKGAEGARAGGANPTAEQPLPRRIASYEIVRPIGRGGMGAVHEGRAEDGTRVAVKVIHPHLLGETRYVARFLREAEIGSHIRHENVVRTLESGVLQTGSQGLPYLVLEFVEGQSLRALLDEVGRVPERLCRHIGLCVARALEVFEAAGVVHRDLKPANVVITPDETVKVMDLGVASLQEAEEQLTKTGQFVGSFRYAAPEQLAGKRVDARADLYSLGLLLYELSTGVHPASAREDQTVISAPPPSSLASGLSAFFDGVVGKLLSPAPPDRFQTATELREVFEAGERSDWWRRSTRRGERKAFPFPAATAFRGRDAEVATLDRLLREVREGAGRVLLVEGEAGIGKSRLLREWLRATQREAGAPTVVLARHDPGEGGLDLFPLGSALREHLGTDDLEATLRDRLEDDEPLAGALAAQLRGEAPQGAGGGGPGTLAVGVLRLLRSLAAEAPVVLAIEDLHFAGRATRALIPYRARAIANDRILLFVSSRPFGADDPLSELLVLPHAERLTLAGLDTAARMAVLHDAIGTGELHPREVSELARKSDGNPYFLLELAGARATPAGLASDTTDATVPPTLQALLERRLASLSESDRELLEAAACAGFVFDPELLAAATGQGLIATLKQLARMERVARLVTAEGSAYRFHHHLLQEVLYAALHPRLREAHHAALGQVLLDRVEDPEQVDRAMALELCTHCFRGGRPSDAAPFVIQAAAQLRVLQEFDRSTALIDEALEVDGLLTGADLVEALWTAGAGAHVASNLERSAVLLERACRAAVEADLPRLESRAARSYANLRLAGGEHEVGCRLARRAVDAARRAGLPRYEAHAWLTLARGLNHLGRWDESREALDVAQRIAETEDDQEVTGVIGRVRSVTARTQGRLEEAAQHASHSAASARRRGDRGEEMLSRMQEGVCHFLQGRFADALQITDECLQIGTEIGLLSHHPNLVVNGAACMFELGRLEESVVRCEEAARIAERLGQPRMVAVATRRRGSLLAAQGELEAARSLLGELQVLRSDEKRTVDDVMWRVACCEVLGALGRFEEASTLLDELPPPDNENVDPSEVAQVLHARLSLLEGAGRFAEAAARLDELAKCAAPAPGHGRVVLATGRLALRRGETGRAREAFEEALAWARPRGCLRVEVPARVVLATLGDVDLLSARVELEQAEAGLPRLDALEAHTVLWEHSGDAAHLDRAREILEVLRAGAAPEDRDRMIERVALYQRVVEA